MLKIPTYLILILLFAGFNPASNKSTKPKAAFTYQPAKPNPIFLFLSDIHLDATTDTTAYGVDTGLDLWNLFLAKADEVLSALNAPQFIVYTGDLPAHYAPINGSMYIPVDQRATHNGNLTAILTSLRNMANKHNKPLFYLPGNNDGLAGDYYSFTDSAGQTPLSLVPDAKNPYPALNINRAGKKAPCLVSNPHPTMGYYSAYPIPGLRLIALNTVMNSKKFVVNDGSNIDADRKQQMKWLATQLAAAKENGEKVYLAMHVPPGMDAFSSKPMWDTHKGKAKDLNEFLGLVAKYQSTITGILTGHTHMEEVRRLYDSTGQNILEVSVGCPGVTPQHGNNPGFKTVEYNAANKELMDFTTYYTLPTATGTWGTNTYTFSSAYQNIPNTSIYQRLKSLTLTQVYNYMNPVYNVMHGPGGTVIQGGIEVKWGK
jgi:sphingomyelin phosphodiesterase acid-like 3